MTNYFVDFIHKMESDIEECFNTKKIKKEFISLITKKNYINFIKANLNDNVKITSNIETKKKITLNDFKINGQIDIVIKISYLWSKNVKMGLSSQIYQIKYWGPPEQLNINFIDPDFNNNTNNNLSNNLNNNNLSNMNPNPEELVMKSLKMSGVLPTIELPQQIKLKVIPSLKDLQKAIKGLKTFTSKDESIT